MATIPLSIAGGTPPYTVTVTEASSGTAVSCSSGCASSTTTSRNVVFTPLSGTHNYRVITLDSSSPACSNEQMTGNLTCTTVTTPSFSAGVVQPVCTSGTLSQATVQLTGISNGNRYQIYMNSSVTGNDCTGAISFSGSSVSISVAAPAATQSQVYSIRMWGGTDCSSFFDQTVTVTSPSCSTTPTCTLAITLGTATC